MIITITIVIIAVIFFLILACVIAYTAGRARGFEECYKQYVSDFWDRQQQHL